MEKLIRFELYKLLRQKSFYICTAVMLLFNIFQISISWSAREASGAGSSGFTLDSLVNSGSSFLFTIILAIFVALFVCDDYSGGTIRVILARGFTRTQVYFSKLIVLCMAMLVLLILCWFSAIIAAKAFSGGSYDSFNLSFIRSMLSQLFILLAYTCLFCAVSSAIQKSGAAIAICIVIPLAVTILLTSAEAALNGGADAENAVSLTKYWLDRMLTNVSMTTPLDESVSIALKASPVYFIVSAALGWLVTVKREY